MRQPYEHAIFFLSALWSRDVPKSTPMTGPRIFLSSELYRTKEDAWGERKSGDLVAEDVARGSYQRQMDDAITVIGFYNLQLVLILKTTCLQM